MTWFFKLLLTSGIVMGALTFLYLALMPLLQKRYRANTLYLISLILAVGFLIPFRPQAIAPAVTVYAPQMFSRSMWATEAVMAFEGQPPTGKDINDVAPVQLEEQVASERSPDTSPASDALDATINTNAHSIKPASLQSEPASHPILTAWDILAVCWLAGALFLSTVQVARHRRFMRTVHRWQTIPKCEETLRVYETVRREQCPKSNVRLMVCPSISTPMLVGLFRPIILLPDESLCDEELALVLTHELTHLRQRHLWVKAGLLLMTMLNWFNPAAWLLLRFASFSQEISCDERVTAYANQEDKIFYSETILHVIRQQTRLQTVLTTSFYDGKEGMKRRITSIIAGGRRVGIALCAAVFALSLLTGIAFSIGDTPPQRPLLTVGQMAYIANSKAAGTRMLGTSSINDWSLPHAVYFNGTSVTILELNEGSSVLPEWNLEPGNKNWARVSVGGDGVLEGMQGWIPVCFLSTEPPSVTLPFAALSTDATSGHINIFRANAEASGLLSLRRKGETAEFLGLAGEWAHLKFTDVEGFVPLANVTYSADVNTALGTFIADRFDYMSHDRYQALILVKDLVDEKSKLYGTVNVEMWPPEGKAWYSELSSVYGGGYGDRRYLLPDEHDLREDLAVDIAWDKYTRIEGIDPNTRDGYIVTPVGLYTLYTDPSEVRLWQVRITPKPHDTYSFPFGTNSFEVVIGSPGGEILATSTKYASDSDYVSLPDEDSIPQEDAVRIAKEALMDAYQVQESDFDLWEMNIDYYKIPGEFPVWRISFHDEQGKYLGGAIIDAYTGEVMTSMNPHEVGLG